MQIDCPAELRPLYEPWRFKIAYGGRNGLKSWSIARALLIQGASRPLRILCTREVQHSIKQSVHKLLKDQVAALGLGSAYEVQEQAIKGYNGTEFMFAGLSDMTAENVKSFEGVDVVWCEEGQGTTDRSWRILIPTIRKSGSEIWVSLNPDLDTDATYQRFIVNTPPRTALMPIGWQAAERCGWFSAEAKEAMEHDRATMTAEDFANTWEGKPRSAAQGAIYTEEMQYLVEGKRITSVEYDSSLRVQLVLDLGWNDAMGCALVQKHLSSLRVIEYLEVTHKTLAWLSSELRLKRLNWGTMYLPHDGAHKNIQTGKSAKETMEALGWTCEITPSVPVEMGIRAARETLKRMWIDQTQAARLVECVRRYRREVPKSTGEPGAPRHDEYSHGADVVRYIALNADAMTNESYGAGKIVYPTRNLA